MLYTGAGDGGETRLFNCDQQKISKFSEVTEALGALDELNSFLGFVKVRAASDSHIAGLLRETQENLFTVQAEIAGANKELSSEVIEKAEKEIDKMEKEIPKITGFSIPGGTELSALLDTARAIARRAERRAIAARDAKACKISNDVIAYLNRLSSLLFVLARLANHRLGIVEESPHY